METNKNENPIINWIWNIIKQNKNYIVIRLKNILNQQFIGWKEIIENYTNDLFVDSFIEYLMEINPFNEYYIEFNPITFNQIESTIFEFVLIKTNNFASNADILTFDINLLNTNSNKIVWFSNPSNSALLITPCYNHFFPINDYIHIGTFMRSKNKIQKSNLIKTMFKLYFNELINQINKKLWLSTHGKGVGWLHIRIDKSPCYITWNPYK